MDNSLARKGCSYFFRIPIFFLKKKLHEEPGWCWIRNKWELDSHYDSEVQGGHIGDLVPSHGVKFY